MQRILSIAILSTISVPQANAATYNYQQVYQIDDGVTGETLNEFDSFVNVGANVSRNRSAAIGGAEATSVFSIDRDGGVVKLGASVQQDNARGGFARTELEVREIFTASGTGTATFRFDLDGLLFSEYGGAGFETDMRIARWSGSSAPGQLTVEDEYSAGISVFGSTLQGGTARRTINGVVTDEIIPAGNAISGGLVVNEVLELSYNVLDGSSFSVSIGAYLSASVSNNPTGARSDVDFMNTGFLSFETTDGLSLTASDPLFLSTATGRPEPGVSPVPLPASALFLLAGLAGFGFLRQSRPARA